MLDRIPNYLRRTAPFFLCLLIILFSQMPGSRFVCVPLIFIPIFYFALFRSRLLNAYMAFGLGVFTDLINHTPFGLTPFIFVAMFFIARLNRPLLNELSYRGIWAFFTLATGVLLLIQLFLFTLCEESVVHTKFLFEQFVVVILLYPLLVWVCDRLNHWIQDGS